MQNHWYSDSVMKTLIVRVIVWALAAWSLSACSSERGAVTLRYPTQGAIIYSPALYVAGSAQGVDGVRVRITSAEGLLTETTLRPVPESWSVELVHGYSGVPLAVTLSVLALGEDTQDAYATLDLTLAALGHRPEGAFAYVVTPQDGDSMGGDSIMVSGRASGRTTYAITVTLVKPDGTALDTQSVTVETPYPYDELGWEVTLTPHDYVGEALLIVDYGDGQSERISITLSTAAG